MNLRILSGLILAALVAAEVRGQEKMAGEELFSGPVPTIRIEIPPEGMEVLRQYRQVWRQERPKRVDVRATVIEGGQVYKDVAVHLKGAFSFQGIDAKPSLTLNFDKFVPKRRFHGLSKIHLNNSVQDPSGLCEQFARELFKESGIVAPRATPALVQLNGRDLGVCVLVEGANKSFVKRNFDSAKGNLYDAGSGQIDVTKDLPLLSGKEPPDRSDLKALVDAAREEDPARRLQRLEKVLDVEWFITFAAIENLLVHWDGYCFNCNNYRVFHDKKRGKLLFMPHGLDQLFGTSNSPEMSLTPMFKGMLAKALFGVPEARARYLKRIEELSKTSFSVEALHGRGDRLAKRLGEALADDERGNLEYYVNSLKRRIEQRGASVARQLANRPKPLKFGEDGVAKLAEWTFKPDSSRMAQGGRTLMAGRQLLRVSGGGGGTGGSWRATALLEEGHYRFTGLARTRGAIDATRGAAGVMLRISGETRTDGITISDEWKEISYEFHVQGLENVLLVCEFRSSVGGLGEFDAGSLKLIRTEPGAKAERNEGAVDQRR